MLRITNTVSCYALKRLVCLLLICIHGFGFGSPFTGPVRPDLQGLITDTQGNALPGVTVRIKGGNEITTDDQGYYRITPPAEDMIDLVVEYEGRVMAQTRMEPGQSRADFVLSTLPTYSLSLVVASTRTDSLAETNLSESSVRRLPANVTGEVLRSMPGVSAVRRGPVGLDPVVRGLRETEVGTYLDGSRLFPGGPGRMDSGLSHLDPSTIERIQVVKGPYALTWGAGNLSAIQVESFDPSRIQKTGGALLTGYRENGESYHFAPSVFGRKGDFGFWAHAVERQGNDYKDGHGQQVPGHMSSREIRAKLSHTTPVSQLTLSAGYQEQNDLDYPGRLLDADFFETENISLKYRRDSQDLGLFQSFTAQVYYNHVDHGMDNDEKPTAQPNPNRMPPFPMAVYVDSGIAVTGTRLFADLEADAWRWRVGLDYYRARRDALRTIARRDTGMIMIQDRMWPNAVISDGGVYARGERFIGENGSLSASLRMDFVEASSGNVTEFFAEHAGTQTHGTETNPSGALTYRYSTGEVWSYSLGLGSVVRTADANERYSDRIPASKAQMSAEFLGNPQLDPERATQFDFWLEGSATGWSFNFNAFARQMDDFITIEATELPRKLALSPQTVYRYINGEAEFYGAEAGLKWALSDSWFTTLGMEYLRGEDTSLKEPAFGVTPFTTHVRIDYLFGKDHQVSLVVRDVASQNRVATQRGETPTNGYTLLDLMTDWTLGNQFTLSVGATNLTDEAYTHHLNAKNPFSGLRIQEAGRSLYCDLRYRF